MSTIEITEERLKEILELNDNKTYLIDFYANWCGPCKVMAPKLENLANTELADDENSFIFKVNVEEIKDREIMAKFEVRSIPNMIFIKNGEAVDRFIGVVDPKQILEKFEAINS